ncbi:MAG: DUF4430 domain-containing protein [Caloramator sp.]|nr:DUF4430 domain-containing protein [Caloramator sp.]
MKKLLSLVLITILFISCVSVKSQNVDNTKENISSTLTLDTNKELNYKKDKIKINAEEVKKGSKEIQETKKEIKASTNVEKKEISIRLIISKEGTKDIIFDKMIKTFPGKNALQILKENANVYEVGGFIKEINGIASIPQNELSNEDVQKGILGYDWFVYLNGKKTKVGAKDIILKDRDILNFDYKGWTIKDLAP